MDLRRWPKRTCFTMDRVEVDEQSCLDKLVALAESWGGYIETDNSTSWFFSRDISVAPFNSNVGLIWEEKGILYDKDRLPHPVTSLLHEMGHVFACRKPPKSADELDFLGWEFQLARQIGYPVSNWLRGNEDYVVLDGDTVGDLLSTEREPELINLLKGLVQSAENQNLLVKGVPVAIR